MMIFIGITMMILLNAMKVRKNQRLRNQRLRKNSCLLLGIHQDIWIGVFLKMKKRDKKIIGIKNGFFCLMNRHKIFRIIFKGINKKSALALRENSFYGRMKEVLDHPPASIQGRIREIQETLKKFVQINRLSFTYLHDF